MNDYDTDRCQSIHSHHWSRVKRSPYDRDTRKAIFVQLTPKLWLWVPTSPLFRGTQLIFFSFSSLQDDPMQTRRTDWAIIIIAATFVKFDVMMIKLILTFSLICFITNLYFWLNTSMQVFWLNVSCYDDSETHYYWMRGHAMMA